MSGAQPAVITVMAGSGAQARARADMLQAVARHWQVPVVVQVAVPSLVTEDAARPPHVVWLQGDVSSGSVAEMLRQWRQVQPVAVLLEAPLLEQPLFADAAWTSLLGAQDVLACNRAALWHWLRQSTATAHRAAVDLQAPLPELWTALRSGLWPAGAAPAACVQESDSALQWLDSAHARGWLQPDAARQTGDAALQDEAQLAATALALAKGFVAADAVVLGLSVNLAGQPVPLPRLSWGALPRFEAPLLARSEPAAQLLPQAPALYAIADDAPRLRQCAQAGAQIVQLRRKLSEAPSEDERSALRQHIAESMSAAQQAGATLFINDHREVALALGAGGLHLGQEDLLALTDAQRAELRQSRDPQADAGGAPSEGCPAGVGQGPLPRPLLGISSHSVWELARARSLVPDYVACGPVWATTTKDMPWIPQSLHNLRWWVAQAGCPVVAIGGILEAEQICQTAATGAAAVCVVRGLGNEPSQTLPVLQAALREGHARPRPPAPPLPLPSLLSGVGVPDRFPDGTPVSTVV